MFIRLSRNVYALFSFFFLGGGLYFNIWCLFKFKDIHLLFFIITPKYQLVFGLGGIRIPNLLERIQTLFFPVIFQLETLNFTYDIFFMIIEFFHLANTLFFIRKS